VQRGGGREGAALVVQQAQLGGYSQPKAVEMPQLPGPALPARDLPAGSASISGASEFDGAPHASPFTSIQGCFWKPTDCIAKLAYPSGWILGDQSLQVLVGPFESIDQQSDGVVTSTNIHTLRRSSARRPLPSGGVARISMAAIPTMVTTAARKQALQALTATAKVEDDVYISAESR
jgi:hypothetical protein